MNADQDELLARLRLQNNLYAFGGKDVTLSASDALSLEDALTATESTIAKVFEDTRERCAKVCDAEKERANWPDSIIGGTAEKLAVQIRALSANETAAHIPTDAEAIEAEQLSEAAALPLATPRPDSPAPNWNVPHPNLSELSALLHQYKEDLDVAERDLTPLRTGCLAIAKRIRPEGHQGLANELEELGK